MGCSADPARRPQPWHGFAPRFGMPQRKANKTASVETTKRSRLNQRLQASEKPVRSTPVALTSKREAERLVWVTEKWRRQFNHKRRMPAPHRLPPMLASSLTKPFNDKDWQFEIKWDGYRAVAYLCSGKVDLRSRNQLSLCNKFPEIGDALRTWPVNAVVDGEIVVLSNDGKADFGALQSWRQTKEGTLVYYVFDLLWLDGIDLQKEPLVVRQEALKSLVPEGGVIRFSDSIDECGVEFYEAAKQNGLEGIIAKRKSAPYRGASRSKDWFKIKVEERHEALICGYTKKKGTDRLFSSLLLGLPDGDKLAYIGAVGTGFSSKLQDEILRKLKPLATNESPFGDPPQLTDYVQWVRPHFVCEVKYTERTKEGLMRHPSFQGLRDDKFAPDLNVEDDREQLGSAKSLKESRDQKHVTVDGHPLTFTNLRKIYWPKERVTKGDLINYYQEITPCILPYMLDRPQSLNRFPNGVNGESFYQKNMRGKVEPWLKTFERFSDSAEESKDFLVCTGEASLLYMVNLGCIEMNPWHSRVRSPHYPDWCVIDLDPGEISFERVIEAAQVIHKLLDSLGVVSYPKTSGSTGLHIYIPLGAKYNYEQSRQLAELLVTMVHGELPKTTSLLRNPAKRRDKIYLDFLQNRAIQTICAPYSVRPRPGATVSAPLHWDEVRRGLAVQQFTLKNMQDRIRSEGDLFSGVLAGGIDLNDVLKTLARVI